MAASNTMNLPKKAGRFDFSFEEPSLARSGSEAVFLTDLYTLDEVVAGHISAVLDRVGGRVEGSGGAAELLGVNPGTLRHRMRRLGVPFGRKAQSQGQ